MCSQTKSILIPDVCDKPLAYYAIRGLKAANRTIKINIIVSSDKSLSYKSWLNFYNHSFYVDRVFFSRHKMNSEGYLKDVINKIKELKIDILFPASEEGIKFTSRSRKELTSLCRLVPLPEPNILDMAWDKWQFYSFLENYNISLPKTFLLKNIDNFGYLYNKPILLKPIDGSGGQNIQKFESLNALMNNKDELKTISHNDYIVQEYIQGYDLGCNVICLKGEVLAHTIQLNLGKDSGFSAKIDKLKFIHNSAVIDTVKKIMQLLQWNGVANLDLRYDREEEQFKVLEINPRFWQSLPGSLSVNVNFPYLLYLLANDVNFEPVDYPEAYYVKVHRMIRDLLDGSLQYSLSNTNINFFFSDSKGLFYYLLHRFLSKFA